MNLGSLYLPIRAVEENPTFSTDPRQAHFGTDQAESIHAALVKVRAPRSINDDTLRGIAHSLSQLGRLGLSCIVVIDPEDEGQREELWASNASEEADRIVSLINTYGGQGARKVDSIIGINPVDRQGSPSIKVQGDVYVTSREILLAPLCKGMIPVVTPIGFESLMHRLAAVGADEVILALTREFAGLYHSAFAKDGIDKTAANATSTEKQVSIDRIIVLDPLGGIPSTDGYHNSHVFINLEQEFSTIKQDLLCLASDLSKDDTIALQSPTAPTETLTSAITSSNTISKAGAQGAFNASVQIRELQFGAAREHQSAHWQRHVKNLDLLRHALALLPPSSSAYLTTPEAVANSDSQTSIASEGPRVRTRRYRNPLIHNLLTDKPMVSSSLPSKACPGNTEDESGAGVVWPATFFKRGMPVSIIPDPLVQIWTPPSPFEPLISLSDPRIDLSRLVYLIEDSFGRKLDVTHYLDRIRNRIAGIIIAGEYEGGAILTWETPPGFSPTDPKHMVPYLDKFTVLKRSQGAGGVADIVFKAMVRRCFPNGVCWRSRKSNPVNRWYFERAKGTWMLPDSNWTMFWTTEGLEMHDTMFSEYESVCRSVVPSWADHKDVVD